MTAPNFRTVDQQTGYVAPGADKMVLLPSDGGLTSIPALQPDADELAQLRSDLDDARAEVDNLTTLLKASGAHVANLSSGIAQYQVERDEYREAAEEWRDRYDLACDQRDEARARVQELSTALAIAVTQCDTANAKAAVL